MEKRSNTNSANTRMTNSLALCFPAGLIEGLEAISPGLLKSAIIPLKPWCSKLKNKGALFVGLNSNECMKQLEEGFRISDESNSDIDITKLTVSGRSMAMVRDYYESVASLFLCRFVFR